MTVPRFNSSGRFDPACLFRPASVAVIGAETETGAHFAANLALSGFTGDLQAVRDAADLASGPQLAVVAVPTDRIGQSMAQLAARGCFAAIVPGPCEDLHEHTARTGVRALGPHAFGIAIPRLNLNASRSHLPPPPGRLALVCQSSSLARTAIDWAEPNGVGFSHIVGLGRNADIGFGIALDWLSRGPGTGTILLDIRRIKNHRVFLSAARAAAKLRPVVAIRAGLRLLDGDGAAALSFEAALRRAGVLFVERWEDLLAAAETLSRATAVRSGPFRDTLAIVSTAIGPGRLAADSVLRHGLRLRADEAITVVTPADLASTAFALAALADAGGVLAVHAPHGRQDDAAIARLCQPPHGLRAPLLVCAMGETTGAIHRRTLARAGLPVFATPDQAVQGFEHLVRDSRNREAARELPPSTVLDQHPDRDWIRRCFARVRASGRLSLTQDEALGVLSACGIPTTPARVAASAADAAAAAESLSFPTVLKIRDTAAPTDRLFGSVMFDLYDSAQVAGATALLSARARRHGLSGEVLVQRHAARAREVAIRVADDATFGPTIVFGGGGTAASPEDRAADLPPLNLPLAQALIRRSRTGAMLEHKLRDHAPADSEAVAQALVRISQAIIDFPDIAVLEVPSLFAGPIGVLAVDAWLRLRAPEESVMPLAIAPYPVELTEYVAAGADRLTIRPIRPEDAAAHIAFFGRLSPEDVRYRFFSAMRALSAEQTARLTQVDYDREMAFIAIDDATGDTIGVSRLACDSDRRSGEFAIIVQADKKGRGIASLLMQPLIAWARMRGLTTIAGQILADNRPMLAFVRHLGFTVHRMPDDPEVMEATLLISEAVPPPPQLLG